MHYESSFVTPQADKVVNQMNRWGNEHVPFLFIIDFEMTKPVAIRVEDIDNIGIKFEINSNKKMSIDRSILLEKHPVEFEKYRKAFNKIMSEIKNGNTYLLNLTFPTHIKTNLSIKEIYNFSFAKYKLLYKDEFVVFSPETFVKIDNGVISSYPMKGTIDASIKNAEQIILNDEKEIAEHNTIVDLIRNDLSIISKNVHVEKFRYVEKLCTNNKTLLQVSSKISGELDSDYTGHIGDIIFNMLPAGSISGAPKKKTIEIIREAEEMERGYFTGVFGIFDGKNLDSAVMIRYIENTSSGYYFRSGGGITHMSIPELEYQELMDKVYVPFG